MIIFSLITLAISVYLFIIAGTYPGVSWASGGGPGVYSQLVLVILILSTIAALITHLMGQKELVFKFNLKELPRIVGNYRFFICFALCLLLAPKSLGLFGFKLSALLVFIISGVLIKKNTGPLAIKDFVFMSFAAIIVVFGIDFLFENVIRVLLPKGILLS